MRNIPARLSRLLAPVLLVFAGSLWSTPAAAQWETVQGFAIQPGGSCPAPHSASPQLRRSDRRPFEIPAGFRGEIEIYGHWLDQITSAWIPNRGWATYARGIGGPENAIRGCGAIGSLVVSIDVPHTTPAGTHWLNFGDQRLRVRIIKPSIERTVWSPQSERRSSTVPDTSPQVPPPPPSEGCGQTGGPVCGEQVRDPPRSGGILPGSGESFASPDDPPRLPAALGRCIGDGEEGGTADISGSTLTVTLPTWRDSESTISCLTRPLYFNVEMDEFRGDVLFGNVDRGRAVDPPRYTGAEGLIGPTPLDDPNRDFQQIRMTEDFARTFVGERRILLRPRRAGTGATPLTLVLRSYPVYGIRDIEGVPFTGIRTSSTIEIRFDFLGALVAETRIFWWLGAAAGGPNPWNCFTASSGTLTSRAAIGRFTLTVRERRCDNARFILVIGPERNGQNFNGAPYSKRVTFELPPLTAPNLDLRGVRPRRPPRN